MLTGKPVDVRQLPSSLILLPKFPRPNFHRLNCALIVSAQWTTPLFRLYYSRMMASERVQRNINRCLPEARDTNSLQNQSAPLTTRPVRRGPGRSQDA